MNLTLAQLTQKYIDLRNRKKEIEGRHDEELAPYRTAMSQIETLALDYLNQQAVTSLKTEGGTCFKVTRSSYKIADAEVFLKFVEDSGRADMLEKRPAKSVIDEYVESGSPLPPGLDLNASTTVQFRK